MTLTNTITGVSALVDFILALWPLSMVPKLKVSLRAKIGFCLLMGLGTITGVASIYRDIVTQESVSGTDVSRKPPLYPSHATPHIADSH